MKSLAEHMAFYSLYHRNPRNRLTHFIGVPIIIYAALVWMSYAHVALGPVEPSLAALFVAGMLVYYILLDWVLGLSMVVLAVPLCWVAALTAGLGLTAGLAISGVAFVGGWALQLLGHRIEGNRPALTDNLFQTAVSPIFLTAELFFALGVKLALKEEVERRVLTRDFAGAERTAGAGKPA
jgi:uncharacterized membrane protein YGL010W